MSTQLISAEKVLDSFRSLSDCQKYSVKGMTGSFFMVAEIKLFISITQYNWLLTKVEPVCVENSKISSINFKGWSQI